jgi:hypothetical protein
MVVMICVAGLPFAPVWQVAQLPGATPVWLNSVPANDDVDLWQVSHAAFVTTCVAGLNNGVTPANDAPLWQLEQPVAMPVWFIIVPENVVVDLWQVSQPKLVCMWLDGLAKPAPPNLWQLAQLATIPV